MEAARECGFFAGIIDLSFWLGADATTQRFSAGEGGRTFFRVGGGKTSSGTIGGSDHLIIGQQRTVLGNVF